MLPTATFFPEKQAGAYAGQAFAAGARIFKAHLQVGAHDPRDCAQPASMPHQIEALARLGLGDAWLRGVLHDNGARLIGLPTA